MQKKKNFYLITGGSGFIGSNFIDNLLKKGEKIINIDTYSYAANKEINKKFLKYDNYIFYKSSYSNTSLIRKIFKKYNINKIVNFAAESHVDNSINGPLKFIKNNVYDFSIFLNECKNYYTKNKIKKFIFLHVSTDEVYGSLNTKQKSFTEKDKYFPNSPYSSSKASSDLIVRSWFRTYKFPSIITNCSNNYGKYQNFEKLIPLTIKRALSKKKIPIYGNGKNIRDWLHVDDHCSALYLLSKFGTPGEQYNIGGGTEIPNIEIVKMICGYLDKFAPLDDKKYSSYISFVKDRLGHDFRYSVNYNKLKREFNWKPKVKFSVGLKDTVKWYLDKIKN
ncbi:dTDP-glucose 4,6-dehydratase [Candidatus Pelagibacter bacterium]|nr:dTDP-glucose 4,6-dehydratase [Candidatus Pelagibacter bacterium]